MDKNPKLVECYSNSRPNERGYMKCMKQLWRTENLYLPLTEKQVVTQHFNIVKRKMLSQFEIDFTTHYIPYSGRTTGCAANP